MQARVMDIADCNNHVKSATNFFGPSCAVDSLSDIYNPLGDNSDHLCQLCASKVLGQRCTTHDPYAGYQGAFKCLVEAGEIAFVKHTTVAEMIATELFGTIKVNSCHFHALKIQVFIILFSFEPRSTILSCFVLMEPGVTFVNIVTVTGVKFLVMLS